MKLCAAVNFISPGKEALGVVKSDTVDFDIVGKARSLGFKRVKVSFNMINWTDLAQDGDYWRALMNVTLILGFHKPWS